MDNNELVVIEGGTTMKTMLRILISLCIILLVLSNRVGAYKGQTHRDITDQAVLLLGEEGVFPCFSEDIAEMISVGSVEEDNPLLDLRSWFHYSPTLDFLDPFYYASATCDSITWAFVPGSCTADVVVFVPGVGWVPRTNTLSNDFTWPNATK